MENRRVNIRCRRWIATL